MDQSALVLDAGAGSGVVSFPMANRTGLPAHEIDHGAWASTQKGSRKLPRLAPRETAYQPIGRAYDRRGPNDFPLGIRIGSGVGADGVRPSAWCERSMRRSFPRKDWPGQCQLAGDCQKPRGVQTKTP